MLVIEDVQFITSSLYFLSLHSVLFCLFFPCLSFCGHFICLSSCLCVSDFLFYFSDPCSVCLVFSFTFLSFIFPNEFQLCCQVCLLSAVGLQPLSVLSLFHIKNAVGSLFVVSFRPASESGFGVLALPEIPQAPLTMTSSIT